MPSADLGEQDRRVDLTLSAALQRGVDAHTRLVRIPAQQCVRPLGGAALLGALLTAPGLRPRSARSRRGRRTTER